MVAAAIIPTARVDLSTSTWSFLTNHSHVLVCIAENPDITVRDLAIRVGITERAVTRIIGELDDAGILARSREGRRNHYTVNRDVPLRHPVEQHCTVGELLRLIETSRG